MAEKKALYDEVRARMAQWPVRPRPSVLGASSSDIGALQASPLAPGPSPSSSAGVDIGTLDMSGLWPESLIPRPSRPVDPVAERAEADAFAKRRVNYTKDADRKDWDTLDTQFAAERLLSDLYLEKKRDLSRGSAGARMGAAGVFADLKGTQVQVGPTPDVPPPKIFSPNSTGAETLRYGGRDNVVRINPNHPNLSQNPDLYGRPAGLNYGPLHEYAHAFGRPFMMNGRTESKVGLESEVHSDARRLARQIGAAYPDEIQLLRREGFAPLPPLKP